MKYYQLKKNNPFRLPDNLYRRVVYTVKDYDRRKAEYNEQLAYVPPVLDGMPSSLSDSDPTANKAIKLAGLYDDLYAVDSAEQDIPKEYRAGVVENAKYGTEFPASAHYHTWQKWRQIFLYQVAKYMKYM